MASVKSMLANPQGWWRLWLAASGLWIVACAALVAVNFQSMKIVDVTWLPQGSAPNKVAEQFAGDQHGRCVPGTIDNEPAGPWIYYRSGVTPVSASDAYGRRGESLAAFQGSCIDRYEAASALTAAILPPLLILLLAFAGRWVWRGFTRSPMPK